MHFGHIRVSDLLLVRHDGTIVEGDRPLNQAAFAIHSQVHAARPDVIGAAHSHSVYGKTWSTLGRLLDPITQDACAFYDDHALFDQYSGVVLDLEEGKRIAHALGDGKAAILRNHGLLTVGHSVEEAAWWFITMERSCQAQLMAEAAGTPVLIDAGDGQAHRGPGGYATSPAGSASSRCSPGSPASSRTCSTERRPVTAPEPERVGGLAWTQRTKGRLTAAVDDRPQLPHLDVRHRARRTRRIHARQGTVLCRLPAARLRDLGGCRRGGLHAAQRRAPPAARR